jgi:hypothetical protein
MNRFLPLLATQIPTILGLNSLNVPSFCGIQSTQHEASGRDNTKASMTVPGVEACLVILGYKIQFIMQVMA